MQFLFETISFRQDKPGYYRIYRVEKNTYFAELVNEEGGFHFRKVLEDWKSEDTDNQVQAEELGEEIDEWLSVYRK